MKAAQWFIDHYRNRAREAGVAAVARQMKKQGVPLEVALEVLCGRRLQVVYGLPCLLSPSQIAGFRRAVEQRIKE